MDGQLALTFLPGAAQGITSVALGHPLDTAKTRMQAMGPQAARSFPMTMYNMAREEGVRSLYRGMTPPLIMSAMKRSLQFAAWDLIRQGRTAGGADSALSRSALWFSASPFRCGAVAGAMGTFIGCPMHVIKIRTQYATYHVTRNAWTCAGDIFRTEGLGGYYRGFRYHLLKDALFASCYLGVYDTGRAWLQRRGGRGSGRESAFIAGCLSSITAWTLLYPFDTVKTIVQARGMGIRRIADLVWRDKGVLYRGIGASLVRAGPVSGASMFAYELVKDNVNRHRHRAAQEWMRNT